MNCDWVKENVVLYIYGELPDDARFEFEGHVRQCVGCKRELHSVQAFKDEMSSLPVPEVSPNLLTASRMKLQESLEHAEQHRGLGRFFFDLSGWMQQIKLAPALTAALLMFGFAAGALTTYRIAANPAPPLVQPQGPVASIESISQDPTAKTVSVKYDTLSPNTVSGSPDDPKIQQLLLLAARNQQDAGVQLESMDLLTRKPEDNEIREALIYALRYDKNPGVRLKALDGLKDYVKTDIHVRDAVLEALIHDTNPGVRSDALNLLKPVKADTSVRESLRELAEHDQSAFIRTESRRVLASMPDLD